MLKKGMNDVSYQFRKKTRSFLHVRNKRIGFNLNVMAIVCMLSLYHNHSCLQCVLIER